MSDEINHGVEQYLSDMHRRTERRPLRLASMDSHPRLRTPRSMEIPLQRLYVSKSTRRLVRNLVLIVAGAVAIAWMCVP